jgi:hypothetical protein
MKEHFRKTALKKRKSHKTAFPNKNPKYTKKTFLEVKLIFSTLFQKKSFRSKISIKVCIIFNSNAMQNFNTALLTDTFKEAYYLSIDNAFEPN